MYYWGRSRILWKRVRICEHQRHNKLGGLGACSPGKCQNLEYQRRHFLGFQGEFEAIQTFRNKLGFRFVATSGPNDSWNSVTEGHSLRTRRNETLSCTTSRKRCSTEPMEPPLDPPSTSLRTSCQKLYIVEVLNQDMTANLEKNCQTLFHWVEYFQVEMVQRFSNFWHSIITFILKLKYFLFFREWTWDWKNKGHFQKWDASSINHTSASWRGARIPMMVLGPPGTVTQLYIIWWSCLRKILCKLCIKI